MENDNKKYVKVDKEELATWLAEIEWRIETKNVDLLDLYEDVNDKKQVRSKWTYTFYTLRDSYLEAIELFEKPDDEKES